MSDAPVVIVGAGPAGASCAEAYREAGGSGPVLILGADADPPYERPALSKELLRGETTADEISLHDATFYRDLEVEVRTGTRVDALNTQRRMVSCGDGRGMAYSALVLATGSTPLVPDLGGVGDRSVRTLRDIGDALGLREAAGPGTRILVVGSGFIGCEAASSLAATGAHVTVATLEDVPQGDRLGVFVGERLRSWLEADGVEVCTGLELQGVERSGKGIAAKLSGDMEEQIETDLILLALGIERDASLAESAGIEIAGGAIRTDERMRTSVDSVFAAGDVALAHNAAAGRPLKVEHWGEALNQGAVAGAAIAGDADARWDAAPGFWSVIGERTLKQVAWGDGFDDVQVTEHPAGGFTARYLLAGALVGVLTHDADEDCERGRAVLEAGELG